MPHDDPSMSNDARTSRAQPESFRARSLGASMTVKDLPTSVAWYRDIVGFTVDREMQREGKLAAVGLKAGDVSILLNQDDGKKGLDRKKGEGLSFMLTTAQDVDAIARRIREKGGTLETEPADMPWGARVFTLRDPDNYKFVISTERKG